MTELEKGILLTLLQSQLSVERARLMAIEDNNPMNHWNGKYNVCSRVIDEIERQINILKTKANDTTGKSQ